MPNWCYNTLTVDAKHKDMIINDKNEVDFNLAVPMPDSLHIESGSRTNEGLFAYISEKLTITDTATLVKKYVDLYTKGGRNLSHTSHTILSDKNDMKLNDRIKQDLIDRLSSYVNNAQDTDRMDEMYEYGKKIAYNIENYGSPDWYDWANAHWGTKWNASTNNVDISDTTICANFDTAWCPPMEWLEALAEKGIAFDLHWQVECECAGDISSDGDGSIEESESEVEDDEYYDEEDDEDE